MQVKIVSNMNGVPKGKLADVELHFEEGLLAGLKLVGFTLAVWERRKARGRSVMFPARPYAVNGERCHFTLLRAVEDVAATEPLRERILRAFAEHEERVSSAALAHGHSVEGTPERCQADACGARSSYLAQFLRNTGTSIDSLDVGSPPAGPGSSSTGRRSTVSAATKSAGSGCRQLS